MLTVVAFAIAFFFAMNIGASGTAAAMGPAYGSGAIKRKVVAMLLVGICAFIGALSGGEVVKTIGSGIIPSDIVQIETVIVMLGAACLSLFIANILGIPLSTSEVVVGAIVGVGIAYQSLYFEKLLIIVSFWVIVPIVAFALSLVSGFLIKRAEKKWPFLRGKGKWRKWLVILLILSGCMEAFAAGMNNVANAVGPLVGAGLIGIELAVVVGGAFVALGALLLGGRVLETNGKKITRLSLLQGSAVSITGGGLVIIASIFGLPVPLTQVTTSAIVGVGTADNGFKLWQKNIIKQIIKVWIVSPIFSLVLSYGFVLLFLQADLYTFFVIVSVFIATVGTFSLIHTVRQEKRTTHDQGGGI
ncbi:inorganic phosphate transporter [Halalkalibacterium halodurans]|jgi:sulfate permease|uniref:inorganic phosphate transporter n=1 Tax=Halalkalibacterium halodurans TaxID=86665 RepID=UPI0010682086|nr:inorganic phosphate transporter [Halalkalibacterium halodurans]MDY7222008.1 inorganic phosphate transporter [Halalkalibacterium halodurans]MDY7241284.1 inorganic phosphate transporter [Halalkalibacterium halodurans]TES55031.1 inorganic phosphate transporter [Halalkalibacterium halodurans]